MDEILVPLIAGAILIGGMFGMGEIYGRYQCSNYESIAGKETKWAAFDTCYIKSESGYERWDEYKMRAAASEGLRKK